LLVFEYYYNRYRQQRQNCKALVDSSNYITARTQLQNMIAEHQQKYPDSDTKKDFNYGEKLMIQHALNHLNSVIDRNDPPFGDNGVIKHQSDIVKESLLQIPKQQY